MLSEKLVLKPPGHKLETWQYPKMNRVTNGGIWSMLRFKMRMMLHCFLLQKCWAIYSMGDAFPQKSRSKCRSTGL